MLKVYGLTYDHTTNYGSCFQAYALQHTIENMVIQGEHPSYFLIPLSTFRDSPVIASSKNVSFIIHVKRILRKLIKFIHRKQFIPFEKDFMKYANCHRFADLSLLNNDADAFVCGSDVIWNPDFNSRRGVFFLDFATKHKFSYAASVGKAEVDKEYITFMKEELASFDAISVREKTSLKIVKKCTEKDVQVVVDPVILLDSEEWEKVMVKQPCNNKYIFAYTTHFNNTFKTFLQALKKKTGLQVILFEWNESVSKLIKHGMLFVQSPNEWVSLLKEAEYVVTNSFHATVFSVIFHKKFYTVVDTDRTKGTNVRMYDFLNTIGLESRFCSSVPDTIDLSEIDYTTADEKIASMRTESLAYIQRNLEEAYKQKKVAN